MSPVDLAMITLDGKYTKPQRAIKSFSEVSETSSSGSTSNYWSSSLESIQKHVLYQLQVFDVASYILKEMGEMTTMKLHKLLYYCQAWSLVWDEAPLFNDQIEAWANGPVIRSLFDFHRGKYTISTLNVGNPDLLSPKQKETVNSVLTFYGDKSAQYLIELTHLEAPWREARQGLAPTERGNNVINHTMMAEYYSSL
jgi:uncharacterized phage-associated protein